MKKEKTRLREKRKPWNKEERKRIGQGSGGGRKKEERKEQTTGREERRDGERE